MIHSWILTFTVRIEAGGCGVAVGGSNILTREEGERKEIILFSQSGKGSTETQRVWQGSMGSKITDTDSSEGFQYPELWKDFFTTAASQNTKKHKSPYGDLVKISPI